MGCSSNLPDLVRLASARLPAFGPYTARCRSQARTGEPALQGAWAGQGFLGPTLVQKNVDQTGAPTGMHTAQTQRLVEKFLVGPRMPMTAARVGRFECSQSSVVEAANQMAHGACRQVQGIGNLRRTLATLPASEQDQAHRHCHGSRHRPHSDSHTARETQVLSSTYEVPGHAPARQNLLSDSKAKLCVR
jgi:hypothetical protein